MTAPNRLAGCGRGSDAWTRGSGARLYGQILYWRGPPDGNGFKAGGYGSTPADKLPDPIPRHTVRFCLAVRNKANGFYANHHPGGSDWLNNAGYRNGADFNMPGQLVGKVLRSPHAHARIKAIDTRKARALPGVKAIITGDDFPSLADSGSAILTIVMAAGNTTAPTARARSWLPP